MASIYDGDIGLSPQLNGAAQISLPLVQDQEYNCRIYTQQWQQVQSQFAPILGNRYTYTNQLIWSEQFENVAWQKNGSTVTDNVYSDPEGNITAGFLQETSGDSPHSLIQDPGITNLLSVNAVVYLRQRQRRYAQVRLSNGTDGRVAFAIVDLLVGQIFNGGSDNGTAPGFGSTRLSDGWIAVYIYGQPTVTGTVLAIDILDDGQNVVYTGTPGVGLFVWRASLSSGVLSPSIKTVGVPRIITGPNSFGFTNANIFFDPLAYQVDESAPDTGLLEQGIAQWTRTHARVSKRTVVPSSIIVTKPSVNGSSVNTLMNNAFFQRTDINVEVYDVYSSQLITGDSGPPTYELTGGTYTLSFAGDTTSGIAYNASSSDVQTALNSLTSIANVGNCTVAGDADAGFTVNLSGIDPITIDTSSLTVGGVGDYAIETVYQSSGIVDANVYQAWTIYAYSSTGTPVRRPINGGTYTITILGQTTAAIAYNAGADDIASALNALSNVQLYGGVVMFNTPYGQSGYVPADQFIYFAFQLAIPSITGDGTNLTPTGSTVVESQVGTAYNLIQLVTLMPGGATRTIYAENHGATNGGKIWLQSRIPTSPFTGYAFPIYAPVTYYTVIDQNTIQLNGPNPAPALLGYMIDALLYRVGRGVLTNYQPGPINARSTKYTDYYLPGVTLGINSFADIPIPQPDSDFTNFFQAIFDGVPLNYVVGDLSVWKGPIVSQQTTVVDAFDIVEFMMPQLRVTIVGTGDGQVYSDPAGINTTSTQTAGYNDGVSVTLTAVAPSGSAFQQWSGDIGNNTPTDNPITVIASGQVDISANFVLTG